MNSSTVELQQETGVERVDLRWTTIEDPQDPRVALYRMKKVRDHNVYQNAKQQFEASFGAPPMNAHGPHRVLRRLLGAQRKAPIHIDSILMQTDSMEIPEALELLARLNVGKDRVLVADKKVIDAIVGVNHSQYVVSCICAFPVAEDLNKLKPPFLIFDGVNTAENIGSILRTAAALGIESILCSQEAFSNLNSRCSRVSMGAIFHHRFCKPEDGETLAEAIERLKKNDIVVYAAETLECGAVGEVHPHPDRRWALAVGHEGEGVSEEVLRAANKIVYIPQSADFDSINVGHATAICLYEISKGNGNPGPEVATSVREPVSNGNTVTESTNFEKRS